MSLLTGLRVLDLSDNGVCVRFLESLGATVEAVAPNDLSARAADADIVVETLAHDALEHFDLTRFPKLILVSISPFGRSGPRAHWRGGELIASAMGGVLNITGDEDRAPVKEAGDACLFHAQAMAACGAMIALNEREASGRGQHVDISVQDVAISRITNPILSWQFDKRLLKRTGVHISYGPARVRYIWKLKDGYAFHALMTGKFGAPANQALSDWMDERGADNPMRGVDWPNHDRSALPADMRLSWEAAMAPFFESLTKDDIRTEGRKRGINAIALNAPYDVLNDPHLAARDFLQDVTIDGQILKTPSRFVRVIDGAQSEKPQRRETKSEAALAGVNVLDFSWALVGAFTTKALADFGADVIKVESATRPCLSRIDVQVSASRRGVFDDKPWFIHMNTGKRSLRINMKHAAWREIIDPLIEWADVIVENFSPGTMAGFGLDYDTLKARKPGLVMVSGSVFGQTGPLAREWGVDGTGAALSGRLLATGWPDRAPVAPSAAPYGDVVLPPLMSAAAIAAIVRARRTGVGAHIDASMYEVCAQQMAPALIAAQLGRDAGRTGNADAHAALQGVFPVCGEDRWIAIRAETKDDLARLTALAHTEDIAVWTAGQDGHALMQLLQDAGVEAGLVQTAEDICEHDPHVKARGVLAMAESPMLGAFAHQTTPIALSRTPQITRTAPGLGQHNDEICRDIIGLSAERLKALQAQNLFE